MPERTRKKIGWEYFRKAEKEITFLFSFRKMIRMREYSEMIELTCFKFLTQWRAFLTLPTRSRMREWKWLDGCVCVCLYYGQILICMWLYALLQERKCICMRMYVYILWKVKKGDSRVLMYVCMSTG